MKKLTEAYIGYYDTDNSEKGIKISVLKPGMDPKNAYNLDYVNYIANAFNFIIGRVAYFSERYNRSIRDVIVTDENLADISGCHVNHSSRVFKQLRDIFDLDYTRQSFKGGARTIKINKNMIEFMKIYSDQELYEFINKHKNLTLRGLHFFQHGFQPLFKLSTKLGACHEPAHI